jgi:DNA polymerase-3 subunit alpha
MKIKFTQGKDGRVFVNVNDVLELKEAFDRFAKSLSIVVPLESLRKLILSFSEKN